jgi:ribose transport system permease protein
MMNKSFSLVDFLIRNNTYIIFLLLFCLCSLLSDNFFTVMNMRNLALQRAAPICMALGMLFVILTGGIDLAVGSVMAFSASLAASFFTTLGYNLWLSLAVALVASLLLGLVTGLLVAYGRMQGFVASLAMMTIARGIAFVITNGTPVKFKLDSISMLVSKDYGYPILLVTLLVILALCVVQHYTLYGRIVIAVGSNRNAVELAGISVRKHLTSVYALSGLLAGLAGIFVAARSSTGSATIGVAQELDAIAACVIGGASLAGGHGFVVKTVVGVMVLALIGNIMNLMAVPSYPQDIIKGIIIILAVLSQIFTNKADKTV